MNNITKVATMTSYTITNRTSGVVLGVYDGYTAEDALEAMAVNAGYAEATGQTPAFSADLLVTEVPA